MSIQSPDPQSKPIPSYAQVIAGWPLIMIAIGGALGGLCGGGAYGLSMALFKKRGVTPLNCFLSILIGIAGIGLYFGAVVALGIAFPSVFGPKQS